MAGAAEAGERCPLSCGLAGAGPGGDGPAEREGAVDQYLVAADRDVGADLEAGPAQLVLDLQRTGAASRRSAPAAKSLTCGSPERRMFTAATSRRCSRRTGSRCGSPRPNRDRRTTSPPPASTSCPRLTRQPLRACRPPPIPATRAPGSASTSRSSSPRAGGNPISIPGPATPRCGLCAALANADLPCSPAAGAPFSTSSPARQDR
jgi:hypothetical protein